MEIKDTVSVGEDAVSVVQDTISVVEETISEVKEAISEGKATISLARMPPGAGGMAEWGQNSPFKRVESAT